MSTNSPTLFEHHSPEEDVPNDGLFLERLDTFMERSLGEIRAFAERELRPYEETRRRIAQWHAKYLFEPQTSLSPNELSDDVPNRASKVRAVLCDTSRILESLSATAGVQSFLLAVDPTEPSDGGFLGGSVIGREFWRGLRGGGENGAKAFKAHCNAHLQNSAVDQTSSQPPVFENQFSTPPPTKAGSSKSVKNELYESARTALRLASGVRNAEMKWSNPERLDTYGVRLVGWPEGIPAQNPSSLKSGQNKVLLDALQSGSMRFERSSDSTRLRPIDRDVNEEDTTEDFSWAYDANAGSNSPPQLGHATPASAGPSFVRRFVFVDPPRLPVASVESAPGNNAWGTEVPNTGEVDPGRPTYRGHTLWVDEGGGHVTDTISRDEREGVVERPRKRPRSEEPGDSNK